MQVFLISTLIIPVVAQWHFSWSNRIWISYDFAVRGAPYQTQQRAGQASAMLQLIQLMGMRWWGRQGQYWKHFCHNHYKNVNWIGFFRCSVLFFLIVVVIFPFIIRRDISVLAKTNFCVECSLHLCMVPKQYRSLNSKSEEEEKFYSLQKSCSNGWFWQWWRDGFILLFFKFWQIFQRQNSFSEVVFHCQM